MQKNIIINSKKVSLLKPLTTADYSSKTILTDSSWEYVELWLRRSNDQKSQEALFYWQQAKHFFKASEILPVNSKPLTAYYCCLNASKALLSINNINVTNSHHGISAPKNQPNTGNSLGNAFVQFKGGGILHELSALLKESVDKQSYSIKDLLYNLPFIHRTFTVTYVGLPELFIPIKNVHFVREDKQSKAWIQFTIEPAYANGNALKNIPSCYKRVHIENNNDYMVRKENSRFKWDSKETKEVHLQNLSDYHKKIRSDFYYIYGPKKLWYLKKNLSKNKHVIKRSSLTLIFGITHWLSELVRYNPEKFEKYMSTKQNWLIHEFIEKSLYHFIDEISCEITHQEIMSSGYRK